MRSSHGSHSKTLGWGGWVSADPSMGSIGLGRGQLAQYLRGALRLAARLRHRALTTALLLFLCRPGPPPAPGRQRELQIDRLAGTPEKGGGEAAAGWDVVGWWRHHTSILIHSGLPPHGRYPPPKKNTHTHTHPHSTAHAYAHAHTNTHTRTQRARQPFLQRRSDDAVAQILAAL